MANKSWKKKLMLCKIESSYGTDAAPTAALNAILAQNLSVNVESDSVSRQLDLSYFTADPEVYANKRVKISGKVELVGSGTAGTPPPIGPILRACALSETVVASTSVTYAPVSSSFESATMWLNIDGTQFKVVGCYGTGKITMDVGGFPVFEFDLTGKFAVPTEVAIVNGDYSAFKTPVVVRQSNATMQVLGTNLDGRTFSVDLGNQIASHESTEQYLINIDDRKPSGSVGVWIPPVATKDLFAAWDQHTQGTVSMAVASAAGYDVSVTCSKAQLKAPSATDMNGVAGYNIDFIPLPTNGNDEISIAFT